MKTYKVSYLTKCDGHSWNSEIFISAENEDKACQKAEKIVNDDYYTCPYGNHTAEISMDFRALEIRKEEAEDTIF